MAEQQGWSLRTLLDVALDFIADRHEDAEFDHYLDERAAEENTKRTGSIGRSVHIVESQLLSGDFNHGSKR